VVTSAGVVLSDGRRANIVRRVLLALSRFAPRVRRVAVRLEEAANLLGGCDQECDMRLWLKDGDLIQAHAIHDAFEDAVDRAAAQLAKRVALKLDGSGP
jgi:hypothetical protein